MAYSWDNRVKFIVRFMYDIDNNGYLDKNDFECLALRTTVIESKGDYTQAKFEQNRKVMRNLWNEIAELADFNKPEDDEDSASEMSGDAHMRWPVLLIGRMVTVDEFKAAVKKVCVGKPYTDFPGALKAFVDTIFHTIDLNGDGLIGLEEYRVDCCSRQAYSDIMDLDIAFGKLCSPEDKKKGGISLARFQELYGQFIGNPDETIGAVFLFGPLEELV